VDLVPFALIAACFAALALFGQASQPHNLSTLAEHGFASRVAQASYAALFYPLKTLAPIGLAAIHDLPVPFDPSTPLFLGAIAGALIPTSSLLLLRTRRPAAWSVAYTAAH